MPGTSSFDDVFFLHDEYAVVVGDGLQSVGYRDDSCLLEIFLYHFLDEIVSVHVHVGSGFVQNQNVVLPQWGSC